MFSQLFHISVNMKSFFAVIYVEIWIENSL